VQNLFQPSDRLIFKESKQTDVDLKTNSLSETNPHACNTCRWKKLTVSKGENSVINVLLNHNIGTTRRFIAKCHVIKNRQFRGKYHLGNFPDAETGPGWHNKFADPCY
jgi:hypothetical protein